MRLPRPAAVTALGALMLAACGSSGYSSSPSTAPKSSATAMPSAATVPVKTGDSSLGKVLTDARGLTLYGFTQDSNGAPTCVGACATAWPPLTIDSARLPSGLDPAIFSVVARPDGSHQLKAGKWPLYRFAGDSAPGTTTGQGTEGFFVVTPAGTLHKS